VACSPPPGATGSWAVRLDGYESGYSARWQIGHSDGSSPLIRSSGHTAFNVAQCMLWFSPLPAGTARAGVAPPTLPSCSGRVATRSRFSAGAQSPGSILAQTQRALEVGTSATTNLLIIHGIGPPRRQHAALRYTLEPATEGWPGLRIIKSKVLVQRSLYLVGRETVPLVATGFRKPITVESGYFGVVEHLGCVHENFVARSRPLTLTSGVP